MNHSNTSIRLCEEILNEKTCHDLCRKYKFIKRSSRKLEGYEFIKAMIIPSEGLSTDSLQGICKRMHDFNPQANLTAQALCKRINQVAAPVLMKAIFIEILSYMHSKEIERNPLLSKALGDFNRILVEDSTVCALNEKLQEHFKGANRGGTGAKSQIKIDFIYNLMTSTMVDSEIYQGNEPDQGIAGRILQHIQPRDLVLRDLGYAVLKSFQAITDKGAYFLSRLQPNVKVYLNKEDLKPLDLGEYIKEHHLHHNIIELPEVFLGNEKVSARLILYRSPKEVVEKRLREANARAKATGRVMSQGKKLCMQFAAFVTNAPAAFISIETVGTVYRLRWEIELIFKRWKGQLHIDYLKGLNKNRIAVLIWSRLCEILIIEIISGYISHFIWRSMRKETSYVKLISYILRGSKFCKAVITNTIALFLADLENDARRMLVKDTRVRKTMYERVAAYESYYEMQHADIQHVA